MAASEQEMCASVNCLSSYPSTLISTLNVELLEMPVGTLECTLNAMSATLKAVFNQNLHPRQKSLCTRVAISVF